MGSGCFKSSTAVHVPTETTPFGATASSAPPESQAQLVPVFQAASRGTSAGFSSQKLDELLSALCALEPDDSCTAATEWMARATAKAQAGMLHVMQQILAHVLDSKVTSAEELVRRDGDDAGEPAMLGTLTELCEDALKIDDSQRPGVLAAVLVLSSAFRSSAQKGGKGDGVGTCRVPAFDRVVLLFRNTLLAHGGSPAKILQQWRDFQGDTGLPPLEQHLALLGFSAKAVLLSLMLVPDGVAPVPVVVRRTSALLDTDGQLPERHACILSAYFESSAGTKVIQGRRVEGGEGHGPRKEFFAAISTDASKKWEHPSVWPPSQGADGRGTASVSITGNRLKMAPQIEESEEEMGAREEFLCFLAQASPGDQARLEFADGAETERVVTLVTAGQGLAVDKPIEREGFAKLRRCSLRRPALPLFEFHRGTGLHWFGAHADNLAPPRGAELRKRYKSFGKLLALAIVNQCKISFTLPVLFFRLLLAKDGDESSRPALADLAGFDNALHTSLKKALKMSAGNFRSIKELEGLPEATTREQYVLAQVKSVLAPEAFQEVRTGFRSLTGEDALLSGITPEELQQIVCPVSTQGKAIDIRHLFKVVMEDELSECTVFVDAFWSVIDGLNTEEKRQFLHFVTGVETPPEPGAERLYIQLPFSAFSKEEYAAMLSMLPQAHTCTNTLEMPNYHDALLETGTVTLEQGSEVMAKELRRLFGEKLRVAIKESAGYELDATDGPGPVAGAGSSRPGAQETHVQEMEPCLPRSLPPGTLPALSFGSGTVGRADPSPALPKDEPPDRPLVGGLHAGLSPGRSFTAWEVQEPETTEPSKEKLPAPNGNAWFDDAMPKEEADEVSCLIPPISWASGVSEPLKDSRGSTSRSPSIQSLFEDEPRSQTLLEQVSGGNTELRSPRIKTLLEDLQQPIALSPRAPLLEDSARPAAAIPRRGVGEDFLEDGHEDFLLRPGEAWSPGKLSTSGERAGGKLVQDRQESSASGIDALIQDLGL